MNEVITIDLGSNSFRVLKYDCKNHKILDEYHQVVGLADGLIKTGSISSDAKKRVVEALKTASKKLCFNPKDAICLTTAAARKADNSKEVLNYFYEKTGAKFKIIDAFEEARLTHLAVKYALKREKISNENFMILDIGGGSTELTISNKDGFFSKSFDFGIVTMTQKHLENSNVFEDLENRKKEIEEFIKDSNIDLENYIFVATAGTPTTIAAVKKGMNYFNYDKEKVNGTVLNLEDLENSLEILRTSSQEEMINLVGKGRVEFLEVGTYIYRTFFEALKKDESIVLDDGLREGIAVDYCIKNKC